ncbi:MAG: FHA domain-containing protein [Deltaproteobacteria bacterium]|nr:MAG: FHA domain-containing protein [Deltaproteobacteria bacterium]
MVGPSDDARLRPPQDELEGDFEDDDFAEVTRTTTMMVETRTLLKLRRVRLQASGGPAKGRSLVTEREHIRIGSHPSSDFVLEDRTVSRRHAEIRFTERGYLLCDLDSTNGTFLDGKRIERAYLTDGCTIRCGESCLRFDVVDEEISVEADPESRLGGMIGQSLKMRQIFGLIRKIAPMDVTVLITGETGTGKELAARAIHALSGRRDGPFEVLDCGAIPPNLIESQIFGHEKGAFTGADRARAGAFERADGGTIFLDELGELRLDLQPRLLRALENGEVRRVGSNRVKHVDVRVVAATNRDLHKEIQAGNFREDLFFRLSVINIHLPPLRERRDDIPLIVEDLVERARPKLGPARFTDAAISALMGYDWPGNVRELVNVVQQAMTLSDDGIVDLEDLPERIHGADYALSEEPAPAGGLVFDEAVPFKDAKESLLEAFEKEYLVNILRRCGGNISEAARRSGLHRKSIERLVKKYGLDAKAIGRGA